MKFNYIFTALLAMAAVTSCSVDYDAPPLNTPTYTGKAANYGIAQLKRDHAAATQAKPDTIKEDLVVRAIVNSTDDGGNIYKTIYLQDDTAAIAMLVDQGGVGATYRVGQEVFINLKGLVISPYGGEQQIGYPGAYLNRTPWAQFQAHVQKNGWGIEANAVAAEVTDFSSLTARADYYTNRLVKLTNVRFDGADSLTYAEPNGYGSRTLYDANNNTMLVRTSNYAKFGSLKLPSGTGTVYGVLGRYNGAWQLNIRTIEDIQGFVQGVTPTPTPTPPSTPTPAPTAIFTEAFGGQTVTKVTPAGGTTALFPSVDIYTGWTATGLTITDPVMTANGYTYSNASVRSTSTLNAHIWFAAGKESALQIAGFTLPSTTGTYTLSYDITHNGDNAVDQALLQVYAGTTQLSVPSEPIPTKNVYKRVTIAGIPAAQLTNIRFVSTAANNTVGFRIDNVSLAAQ